MGLGINPHYGTPLNPWDRATGRITGGSSSGAAVSVADGMALDGMDADVSRRFDATLTRLSAASVVVQEMPVPAFARLDSINAKGDMVAAEGWAWHRSFIELSGDRYDPLVRSRTMRGKDMSAADYIDVLQARTAWIAEVQALMVDHDTMVMHTVPVVAPKLAETAAAVDVYSATNLLVLRNPTLINFLDGCSISLPCHLPSEASVGLMLAALHLHDRRLFAIGLAIETTLRNS